MKFGDEEWFAKVEDKIKFPDIVAFYIGNDRSVCSMVVKTKAKDIDGIRYQSIAPEHMLISKKLALVSIRICSTSQAYYDEVKKLMDIWDIKPREE